MPEHVLLLGQHTEELHHKPIGLQIEWTSGQSVCFLLLRRSADTQDGYRIPESVYRAIDIEPEVKGWKPAAFP